jgi:structural maintenance of chromosome 4
MVIDTTSAAEKCIAYLKEHKLGRANFICLDRVADNFKRQMQAEFKCPASAKRLFDLVVPADPKFAVAFYYGVKDTLVCESTESAT